MMPAVDTDCSLNQELSRQHVHLGLQLGCLLGGCDRLGALRLGLGALQRAERDTSAEWPPS